MRYREKKEKIRRALGTISAQRKIAMVFNVTGIGAHRLYAFVSQGTLGSEAVALVEKWLLDHDYLNEKESAGLAAAEAPATYQADPPQIHALAEGFRTLAAVLDDDSVDGNIRMAYIVRKFDALHAELLRFRERHGKQPHA